MLIHCTKKLLNELKIAPSITPDDFEPLFSWRAHIITVNRRKTVVLMCDLSRYVVVLYGLKAKDFKELNQRIVAAIRNTLLPLMWDMNICATGQKARDIGNLILNRPAAV